MQTVPCFIYSAELSAVDLCAQVIECTRFIVTASIYVHRFNEYGVYCDVVYLCAHAGL